MTENSSASIRILVIDRHEAVRRALRIRLSAPDNLEVIGSATDPLEAYEEICASKPDVVVLGLHRASDEELDKTVAAVRHISLNPAVVIVLVPYIDAIERELLLAAGVKRYLLKQIDSNQLIHEIESVVASHASV